MSDTEQFFFNSRCAILQARIEKVLENFSQSEKEGVLIELMAEALLESDEPVIAMNELFHLFKNRIKEELNLSEEIKI